jgi:Ras-related GTP-binding protein C/D
MSPHETLFRLEATQGLERAVVDHTPLCRFTIWDFPGDYYGHDSPSVFAGTTSLIFVVDAQDEPYDHVLQSFTTAVTRALAVNPSIAVEVFINKVDGELFLSDESKYDCRRDVMTQVTDELTDAGVPPDSIHVRYHLTSIYDHSIYEALSRVVQRLIPQLPTLENLLNVLVSTCSMEKAYLFDVVSKLYISTDSGPVDMQSVELCSDMIDVVLDVSGIYGLGPSHEAVQAASSTQEPLISDQPADHLEEEMVDPDSAYDSESASVIRLSNGMVLIRLLETVG